MSSELKFVRCGFNGGTERESGRQCLSLKRCLASVIAVSLSIVCMVPAAYAQNIDDVSSSPNAVISEGGGTVVAAPSARNVNVDDKTKRPIHQTVRQHLPKRIKTHSRIHLLHLLLLVILPNPQMVRQAIRRTTQQKLPLAIPLMMEPKRRLQTMLLLKMPRTIPQMRRINRRRRPMCRSPRRRLAAVTLRVRSPRRSTARPTS